MHVVVSTLNSGRGSGTGVVQNAKALVAAGHEVTLVSTMRPPQHLRLPDAVTFVQVDLDGKPIPVHESLHTGNAETVAASRIADPQVIEAYIADYRRALEGPLHGADVVVAHHANLNTVAAADLSAEIGVPLITRVHGTCVRGYDQSGAIDAHRTGNLEGNGYTWSRIRAALHTSEKLVPISTFVSDELVVPHLDFSARNKVSVISNFIDPDEIGESDSADLQQLIEAGRIPVKEDGKPEKGILYLGPMTLIKGATTVAGIADFRDEADLGDVPIYLLGQGDGESLVNGRKNVYFIDRPSDSQKIAAYRNLGLIGVTPNLLIGEDFGRVHKELALAEVPVVAPASGVYPEHIVDGVTGFLIPPRHQRPQLMAREVSQRLQLGADRLRDIGSQARKFVLDNFGKEATVDRFVATVEGVKAGIGEGNRYTRR